MLSRIVGFLILLNVCRRDPKPITAILLGYDIVGKDQKIGSEKEKEDKRREEKSEESWVSGLTFLSYFK
jgi:hypothetical protein